MHLGQRHITGRDADLRIVAFTSGHAQAFRDLNLEWITTWFEVEALDLRHLHHPRESFIETGGAILMAESGEEVVGCCGLLKHSDAVYEISKMAVANGYRDAGIGRRLLQAVIDQARAKGAKRLEIISSTRLEPAIHLYKVMGFSEVPLESDAYARGNIALKMELDAGGRGDGALSGEANE